jgi:HEAT repeat protein
MLSDPVSEVRDTAETAIIKLTPAPDVLKRIGEQCLSVKLSRPYAITILGALKDDRFASQITNYLQSSSDDNIIFRAITALDKFNYKKAEKLVRSKASHPNYQIRQAVAHALGTFALKESFDTLVEFTKLKSQKNKTSFSKGEFTVILEAITSMGRIADPYFNESLINILYDVNNASSAMRSTACWSIARINKPTPRCIKQLKNIILKEIIPSEGGKIFDSDYARISAVLALADMGKKDLKLKEQALEALKKLNPPPGTLSLRDIAGPLLIEFARQVSLYMQGAQDIKPNPIPTWSVSLTVKRYNKRQ